MALPAVAIKWSAQDIKRTERYYKIREAFYIAETGVQQAIDLMNNSPGTEIETGGFDEVLDNFLPNNSVKLTNINFASGTYNVTVVENNDNDGDTMDDDENTLVVTSVGNKDSFSVTLEAIVTRRFFQGNNAITTNGSLGGNGSFTVSGTNGSFIPIVRSRLVGGSASSPKGL